MRKAYIETEACERIRRALRTKVRAAEQVFENGDKVYYKREGRDRWFGPGKVVFQDGKVIFVRHGGVFVRVSPNRLIKAETENESLNGSEFQDTTKNDGRVHENVKQNNRNKVEKQSVCEYMSSKPSQGEASSPGNDNNLLQRLKKDDIIRYKLDNDWIKGKIIGRAGKSSGLYKHWYNVEDENFELKSIDLEKIPWEKIEQIDVNIDSLCNDEAVHRAKMSELKKLRAFDTYEEIPNNGQNTLSTRWVLTQKDGYVKARLVVRGFEEDSIVQRDSPTVNKGCMRLILAVIALKKKWTVKTTDIKSAFLQGKSLDRDVYLDPPPESDSPHNMIGKLKRGLYGLKDGARQFYLSVQEELLKVGFRQCKLDPAVFFIQTENKLRGIICCHVDDFLHAGDDLFENIMEKLRKRFTAGRIEGKDFNYVGFHVCQTGSQISMDQYDFMDKIEINKLNSEKALNKTNLLNTAEQTLFRKLVGKINWAVQGSRPDLAFEVIYLSTKLKQATIGDLIRGMKQVNRLKDVQLVLKFPSLNWKSSELKLVLFTDASLGNINDGIGSVGAYIIWLMDGSGYCSPITWQANKIKRVVRSTIAAEALSLQEGLEASYCYREILEDILCLQRHSVSITAYTDNKSIIEALHSTKLVDDKRLRIDIAAMKETLDNKEVKNILWCKGANQLANCMTKQGASGFPLLKILQSGYMSFELYPG